MFGAIVGRKLALCLGSLLLLVHTFVLVVDGGSACKKLKFSPNVIVTCVQFPEVPYGMEFLKVRLNNMQNYVVGPSDTDIIYAEIFSNVSNSAGTLPPDFVAPQSSGSFNPNGLIGVALDGIPIVSALSSDLVDVAHTGELGRVDGCGGIWGPSVLGTRYHYRVAPTCLYATTEAEAITRRRLHVHDIFDLLEYFESELHNAPLLLGYSLAGIPIYSPLREDGSLVENLDNCNGKYTNGVYSYYSTPTFPYTVGCLSPGLYEYANEKVPSEYLPSISGVKFNACPGGYMPSDIFSGGCDPCPAGRYSTTSTPGFECSQVCPAGYYCPPASVNPKACPSGRYGISNSMGNADCSGLCSAGFYCPAASTTSTAYPCGGSHLFCPEGSGVPTIVNTEYYTIPDDRNVFTRSAQVICPFASYCINGVRKKCPAGTYGNTTGLMSANCASLCPIGTYCPEGSVNPILCPAGKYGGVRGLTDSSCSGPCRAGFWCPAGSSSAMEIPCAAGIYGPTDGLTTSACSDICEEKGGPNATTSAGTKYCTPNICAAGYYCPLNSTSAKQIECGGPAFYCPPGSAQPHPVTKGFYTIGSVSPPGGAQLNEDTRTRFSQILCEKGFWCSDGVKTMCPAGSYGSSLGLRHSNCSGLCSPGYLCNEGSPSSTQFKCGTGSHVYCPAGSFHSILVPPGYYSIGTSVTTRHDVRICPPGSFCVDGIPILCPAGTYSSINGSSSRACEGQCLAGYYCLEGSTSSTQYPCPAGRFGKLGMVDENCAGACAAGYYCPSTSTSPLQKECGGEMVYCPIGSGAPISVTKGYYSTGGSSTTRFNQTRCLNSSFAYIGDQPASNKRVNICPDTTVV